VDALAARAAVSRQTFYQYFRNKSDVLERLMAEPSDVGRQGLRALVALDAPSLEDLEEFIEGQIANYAIGRDTFLILAEAELADPEIRALVVPTWKKYTDLLTDAITRSRRRTGARARRVEVETEALLLVAQLERFCHLSILRGWDADRRTAV